MDILKLGLRHPLYNKCEESPKKAAKKPRMFTFVERKPYVDAYGIFRL